MKRKSKADETRIIHAGISIREKRTGYYMIDVYRNGKRERKCFDSLADAKVHADQLAIAIKNEGASVLDLSPSQRQDAVDALRKADGAVRLVDAVDFWMLHNGIAKGTTLSAIIDKWTIALRGQGCRETTLTERYYKTERLRAAMGDRVAAGITKQDIIEWMDGYSLTGATRDGYRRCFRAMFQYAVEESLIAANPIAGIKKIRMDERLPTPFTVKAVDAIMRTAEIYAPAMVPTLAVQFFAGLRPGEAKSLDWRCVDFDEKLIRITPETSKVRRTRIIDMSDTLIKWLTPYRQDVGVVGIDSQPKFQYWMHNKIIKGKAGIAGLAGVDWIQDGPRKTFASMHYATHGDAAKLASIMGHTGGHDVLFRHYRGLVKKTEAEKFWQIRPAADEKSNVIKMKGAA